MCRGPLLRDCFVLALCYCLVLSLGLSSLFPLVFAVCLGSRASCLVLGCGADAGWCRSGAGPVWLCVVGPLVASCVVSLRIFVSLYNGIMCF